MDKPKVKISGLIREEYTNSGLRLENFSFFERMKYDVGSKMALAHYHDHHEIYYLVSGKTNYFIKNNLYVLSPEDFIFIPKGEYHQTDNRGSVNIERLLFIFNDDFVGEEYMPYLNELFEDRHVRLPRDRETLHLFHSVLRRMEAEANDKRKDYMEMQKLYMRQLLVLFSRHRLRDDPIELSESYKIIQDAATYISANISQDLSLSALAQKYSVSPGHFSKLFKRVTGMGLNEHITISRITAAKELLSSNDMSITEVALECGFNDSNYFTRVFKQVTGTTPKKYANQFD